MTSCFRKVVSPFGLKNLCVFYGYPSTKGFDFFKQYDMVVFGDGIEMPDHPDHANTQSIIGELIAAGKKVFGYVDLGNGQSLPLAEIDSRIGKWSVMLASGIFLDEAGFDYWSSAREMRERQDQALFTIHQSRMTAMLNAWNPQDILEAQWKPGDYWVAESFDDPSTPSRLLTVSDSRRIGLKVAGIQVYKPGAIVPKQGVVDAFALADDDSYGANGTMTYRSLT